MALWLVSYSSEGYSTARRYRGVTDFIPAQVRAFCTAPWPQTAPLCKRETLVSRRTELASSDPVAALEKYSLRISGVPQVSFSHTKDKHFSMPVIFKFFWTLNSPLLPPPHEILLGNSI